MSITYELNEKYDGIEIKFSEKPTAQVLSRLKELGFKWHPGKGVWYAKNTDVRLEFAKSIMNEKTYEQMSLFNMDEVKKEPKKRQNLKKQLKRKQSIKNQRLSLNPNRKRIPKNLKHRNLTILLNLPRQDLT